MWNNWQVFLHGLSKKRFVILNRCPVSFHSVSIERSGIWNSCPVLFHSVSKKGMEYGIIVQFSFIAFLKQRCGIWNIWQVFLHSVSKKDLEYGIVVQFVFIAFLKLACNMEQLASFLSQRFKKELCRVQNSRQNFLHSVYKKRGGIIVSFYHVFTKERAKWSFLVSNVSVGMLTEICMFGNVFAFYVCVSIPVFLFPAGPYHQLHYKFYTYTLSMSAKPNFLF